MARRQTPAKPRQTRKKRNVQKIIEAGELPISDNVGNVDEYYVDGFKGVMQRDAIVKIHFFSDFVNVTEEKIEREMAIRLVMSASTLVRVSRALEPLAKEYLDSGLVVEEDSKVQAKSERRK